MTEIQRINITLPKKLVEKTKQLIDEGLYSSFSELVRESLKNELLMDRPLIEKKKVLDKWFVKEIFSDHGAPDLHRDELIKNIRKTRDELWDNKYKEWFEVL
ncbi:MAG: ribbon-helix-helix domain-containing protein [Nanoarchaeota archaeon]|nr:ribbon-helix-helix domain-containing protein [Nanoarchaeota archaeon]